MHLCGFCHKIEHYEEMGKAMNKRQKRRKRLYGVIAIIVVIAMIVTWVLAMVLQ